MESKMSVNNYSDFFQDTNQSVVAKDGEFSCYLCNATYEKDLQLAAELGKTLLERNKELESALKVHQNIIEDKSQEIEYLTKQTAALKEVNSSRFKIYEQLEISIQDLELANLTLSQQNAADKKQIKNLLETIESLENRCEELQNSLDKTKVELEKQKQQYTVNTSIIENDSSKTSTNTKYDTADVSVSCCTNCADISTQLQESKNLYVREQKARADLQEQLTLLLDENDYFRTQMEYLLKKEEESKTIEEELNTLEQIRAGNLCKRCLRSTLPTEDYSSADETTSIILTNEEDLSIDNLIDDLDCKDKNILNLQENIDNPYRVLVEKYEALLKIQEQQKRRLKLKLENGLSPNKTKSSCLSLQEELQMSDAYNKKSFCYKQFTETDSEMEEDVDQIKECKNNLFVKNVKAEDHSLSENIQHKSVQTDIFAASLPGSFLCKISNGSDCQFSIYDNASPVESRFRKTPEYRQLFREIFDVLKRAAEAKDEGETLPLLDDRLPPLPVINDGYQTQLEVPPATPAIEENTFPLMSEESSKVTNKTNVRVKIDKNDDKTEITSNNDKSDQEQPNKVIQPSSRRDTMEQLMEGVKSRLSSKKFAERKCISLDHRASISPSPSRSRSSSKRRTASKARRKRERLTDSPNRSRERHHQKSDKPVDACVGILASDYMNNGVEKNEEKTRFLENRKERPVSMFCFNTGSSASKEVAKLKILEKSYAEVLRMGRKKSCTAAPVCMK